MGPNDERWAAVERYLMGHVHPGDPQLDATVAANRAAGLPDIDIEPNMGKLLMLLAQMQGARTILEIGTLGGYSTIWLARALPADGRLITLELRAEHAQIARTNIARAELEGIIEVRVGRALDLLPQLAVEGIGPFDLTFIDADKESTPEYFTWALNLSRPGSLIIVDNVTRGGSVIDAHNQEPHVEGMRRFIEMLGAEPRVNATAIQTVGSKRYDGFSIAWVMR